MTDVHQDLKLLDKLMAKESNWTKGQYFDAKKQCGCLVGWCLQISGATAEGELRRFDLFDARAKAMLKAIGFDSVAEAIFYNDGRLTAFKAMKLRIADAIRRTAPPKVKKPATIKKALK